MRVRKMFVFIVNCYWILLVMCTNNTNKRTIEDEYYYDYELSAGTSFNGSGTSYVLQQAKERQRSPTEPLLLPNPELHELIYEGGKDENAIGNIKLPPTGPDLVFDSSGTMIDVLPIVELPDDSLADSDLRDHDFIDNLMYVYYGPASNGQRMSSNVQLSSTASVRRTYGPEVMVIGAVLSCAAQLMTIFVILLRRHNSHSKNTNATLLHVIISMCLANLVFMLGVHASRNRLKCQMIALLLHYLHLLTATWIFMYGYYIYKKFCNTDVIKKNWFIGLTYSIPALFTLVAFVGAPHDYETRRFCFLSVQRGMIVQYMVPVTALIFATTLYTLNGIRFINLQLAKLEMNSSVESLTTLRHELEQYQHYQQQMGGEIASLREAKRCLKTVCVLQMCYCVMWFEAVLALESGGNDSAYTMAVIYSATSLLMNWYIFCRTKTLLPSIAARLSVIDDFAITLDINEAKDRTEKDRQQLALASDSIPLLVNVQGCASAESELHEIARSEYISTISS